MKKIFYINNCGHAVPHHAGSASLNPKISSSHRATLKQVQGDGARLWIWVMLFMLLSLGSLFAQGGNKKEKIEALRVAFITQQLDLTTDESQKFWPVYNEYQDKLKAIRKEFKALPNTFATDKEAQDFLDAELLFKQREVSLYKEYYERFKKVLPIKKIAMLHKAEEAFKRALIENLQGKPNE